MSRDAVVEWRIEQRTEQRLATMIVYVRCGTALFLLIPPILAWQALRHPWLAVVVAAVAGAEAGFVRARLRRTGTTRDSVVLAVDVACCLVVTMVGAWAADPASRPAVLTVLLPFALACPALLGFGMRSTPAAAGLIAVLAAAWSASIYPNITVKLASDLLGFALWFVIARLIAGELRMLAGTTAKAQARAAGLAAELAERRRDAAVMHERLRAHREIHDFLMPVVEVVATSTDISPTTRALGRRAIARARRFLDDRAPVPTPFGDAVAELAEAYPEAEIVTDIGHEPPPDLADSVLAAAGEALRNARRHAGGPVAWFVVARADELLVTVRDRGPGFDVRRVRPGGGLRYTFPAVEQRGATVTFHATGDGTKVEVRWTARP